MAAEEVIYFPFWAQLSLRPNSPAFCPPEPVAESPPFAENRTDVSRSHQFGPRRDSCVEATLSTFFGSGQSMEKIEGDNA